MLALTTNTEWGVWHSTGKVVLGTPLDAFRVKYQQSQAEEHHVPISHTLKDTLISAMHMVEKGALRNGTEVKIPLHIWTTASFQRWYTPQKNAHNDICDAKVVVLPEWNL